jgi:peptidoglycan biosynthesis protein MviN/MurJ (putative lipid II flippase)
VAAVLFLVIRIVSQGFGLGESGETLATATALALYVVAALGYSTLYQVGVKLRLWRLGLESVELVGLAALNGVKAAEQTSSALGEGLADALHVGGY